MQIISNTLFVLIKNTNIRNNEDIRGGFVGKMILLL